DPRHRPAQGRHGGLRLCAQPRTGGQGLPRGAPHPDPDRARRDLRQRGRGPGGRRAGGHPGGLQAAPGAARLCRRQWRRRSPGCDAMTPKEGRPNAMDVFVTRPVLAVVLCLVLMLAGLQAARHIPVLQYPRIESSSLVISTPFVGAPAATVQGFITEPIERIAATVPGVDYVDSSTLPGMST